MENETQEQLNNRPWLYKKGQSGNPGGRPKGSKSMKAWIKERLEGLNDEEREAFLDGLNKDTIWKMAEGNPETKSEVKQEMTIMPVLVQFLNNDETNSNPNTNRV